MPLSLYPLKNEKEKSMPELKGTETEKNLLTAFAGESQARNRYDFFSKKAEQEGFIQISQIFAETAEQEKAHAKRLFQQLKGGEVEIMASFPAGMIGKTFENLKEAAHGEHYEWENMYPSFAKTAKKEGFEDIAKIFESIAVAEKQHEKRYLDLMKNIQQNKVFKKDQTVQWRCLKCGYLHQSQEAPDSCPACGHPKSWFELLGENW